MVDAQPLSAIVLAGGRSSRLGVDKTLIALPGQKVLVEEVLDRVRQVAQDVLLVGAAPGLRLSLPVRLVPDARPGTGSLGGLYSGLQASRFDYSLTVACDMPFLSLDLLRYMASLPRDYDALVPRFDGYFEPLHAIYSNRCLVAIGRQLDVGDLRIVHFYDNVRARYLERQEMMRYDSELLSLFNINTLAQLEFAEGVARRRTAGLPKPA